jgi:TRAP-type C4-dicarboxylate transport system substrate-binding protein
MSMSNRSTRIALTVACATLAAAAPAAAQITLNANSWLPATHPVTTGLLVPLCADFEKATAGLVPLIKHVTYVSGGLYNVAFAMVANSGKWTQISEADRKAIQPLLGEALARRAGRNWDAADARGEAAVREAKIATVVASPALIAEIKAKTDPLERQWVERKAKPNGVDGDAVLKALRAEIAALQKN